MPSPKWVIKPSYDASTLTVYCPNCGTVRVRSLISTLTSQNRVAPYPEFNRENQLRDYQEINYPIL